MTDEELITQLRIQDHSEMCLAAASRIEAITEQLAAANARADRADAELAAQIEVERVQHIKRGSTYRVLGRGKVQTDDNLTDYDEVVIYQGETDGLIWARPVKEFEDGRFVSLSAQPNDHTALDRMLAEIAAKDAEIARLRGEFIEATDENFIWGAMDNVHDADTTLDDYAAAVSRAQRAALARVKGGAA